MMKRLLMLILCLTLYISGQGQGQDQAEQQEDKISRLMSDREQLVMEYQYLNQQNNSFWGNKSKKDLLSIIDTLKEIIRKDSELIAAVKEASIKKIAATTVESERSGKQVQIDQRQINDRISGLQSQVSALQNMLKKRERTIKELEEQLGSTAEERYGKDKVIAILSGVVALLFFYAVFLQLRLGKSTTKSRKKKA
jgi:chromosome segregation ATPase